MNRIRVALFNDPAAAEPIRQRLLQAGIPAEVHDERRLACLWFVSKHSAGARVEVPARLYETALQLLLAWEAAEGVLCAAIRCPECGSLQVDYPQVTRKSLFTNLAIGLIAGIGLVEKDYYCEACHCAWPKLKVTPRHARLHMAPNYFLEGLPQTELGVAAGAHTAELSAQECSEDSPARSAPKATKPARYYLLNLQRKTSSKAVLICGVMLLLGGGAGFASDTNPGSPADSSVKAEVNNTIAAAKQGSAPSEAPTYLRDVLPILMGKCARCHGDQSRVLHNWLDYKTAFGDRWEIKRRVWHSWKGSYVKQPMPTGNSLEAQAMTEEERAIIREWVQNGAPRGCSRLTAIFNPKPRGLTLANICLAQSVPPVTNRPARESPLGTRPWLGRIF